MSRNGFPKQTPGAEHCFFNWSYPNGSVFPFVAHSDYIAFAADKVGGNSPNWPEVITENNYIAWSFTTDVTSCQVSGTHTPTNGTASGQYPCMLITGILTPESIMTSYSWVTDRALELAASRLIKKIKGQKINVLQAAAEFKKTCTTVASTARRLAEAYSHCRRGDIGSALLTLLGGRDNSGSSRGRNKDKRKKRFIPPNSGSAAKDWLAIQYGWRPLLNDIFGACEELAQLMTYKPEAVRVGTACERQEETSYVIPGAGIIPASDVHVTFVASVKGAIHYTVGDQLAATAANTGITNPVAVAWELVPFSFVADWFIPVGSYLSNLDYDNGLLFGKGYYSVKTKGTVTVVPRGSTVHYDGYHLAWSGGSTVCNGTGFQRIALGDFPDVPPPHFKDPISLEHALNALALARTVFSGGTDYIFAR